MECSDCCHESRNALAAVIHLAKKVQKANPSHDSVLLRVALARLDKLMRKCTECDDDD